MFIKHAVWKSQEGLESWGRLVEGSQKYRDTIKSVIGRFRVIVLKQGSRARRRLNSMQPTNVLVIFVPGGKLKHCLVVIIRLTYLGKWCRVSFVDGKINGPSAELVHTEED